MWYRPIQSVASTSSLMSQEMTRWLWPRVSWYVDAVSDERLSDVTRSVSLLARWSPTPAASGWLPDDIANDIVVEDAEVEAPTAPCTVRLRRLSGPIVYGRVCGVRRRTASRCSRALPLVDEEEEEEAAVAANAMVTAGEEAEKEGGKKRGGEEESWGW